MALTVGELVGYIRLDSSQWDSGLRNAQTKFGALGSAVKSGSAAMAKTFSAVTLATAGLGTALVTAGVNYNILQQSSRAAMATLLGSTEAANAQMDKLDAFAKNSPFSKQVFITAQQQLIGFGMAADDVLPTLDAIQNAVAATGGGANEISQITDIIAKISSSAKITATDLMRFGTYGVDAATMIGNAMGFTGAEIREKITEGTLDAGEAIAALTTGMTDRFGGATDAIKQQFVGAVDRIKSAWRDTGSVLATPFVDPMGGGRAVEWANKVADAMRALEQKAKPLTDLIVNRFRPGLDAVTPALDKVRGAINSWDLSKVNDQLDTMGRYAPLIAGVTAAMLAFGGPAVLGPLAAFVPALNPIVAGIAALIAFTPGIGDVGRTLVDGFAPVVPVAEKLGTEIADGLMDALVTLVPALEAAAEAAGPLVLALLDGLTPAVRDAISALVPIAEVAADAVTWIAGLPEPVLATATAFGILVAVKGPVGQLITAIGTPLITAVTNMRTSMEASRGVAEATGRQVGTVGTMALTARAGVSGLGGALKSAFLTNPVGLAITGLAIAFGALVNSQMKARAYVDELKGSLDDVTGEITTNTRAVMANKLAQENGFFNSRAGKSPLEDARELGLGLNIVTDAAMGNTDAYREVEAAKKAFWDSFEGDRKQADIAKAMWNNVDNAIKDNAGSLEEAVEVEQLQKAALVGTTDALKAKTDAMKVDISTIETHMDRTREAAGIALSQKEATLAQEEAQIRATDAIANWQAKVAEADAVNADATKTEEEKTAATRAAEDAYRDATKSINDTVRSTTNATDAMVKNNAANIDVYNAVLVARDGFINQRIAMGDTAEQAAALADEYGLIPDNVLTTVQLNDLATTEVDRIINKLRDFNGRTYTAIAKVNALGNVSSVSFPGSGLTMSENGSAWDKGMRAFADGGGIDASGAAVPRVSQMVQGGRNILWGEPSTGWETYISGKPDQRQRNLRILDDTARRLGRITVPAGTRAFEDGGAAGAPDSTAAAPAATPMFGPGSRVVVSIGGREFDGYIQELADRRIQAGDRARSGYRGYRA